MSIPPYVQRYVALARRAGGALAFLPPLATRLVLGYAFYQTGEGKLANSEGIVEFFTTLGIPFPELNAAFVSRLEYYGGVLLMAGLLTRLVALLLSGTMAVALLTADRDAFVGALDGTSDGLLTDVTPVVYGLFLLWLVVFGPGPVSLDGLVFRRFRSVGTEPAVVAARE
jgi:putative oxidoreductase